MQCRSAGWAAVCVCVCVLLVTPPGQSVEDVEGNHANSSEQVRQSQSLGAAEQKYIHRRKQKVLESLSGLGINLTADSVPHIALLGSGGGQRAAVALLGSLYQMEEDGLLDSLLYIGGVSGSTWSMSSLYSDPSWRENISRVISTMSGPNLGWIPSMEWLTDMKANDQDFSLTDPWAAFIADHFIKEIDTRQLSGDCDRNATNPYPVYNAIEKTCNTENTTEGKWFEVTPHESGFTDLGLFIKTSHLGSIFQAGELLEERPEMDMVKLQGVYTKAAILPLVNSWEWGTTKNFLYQYNDSSVPSCLQSENFYLIDAGLYNNVPYPPFLGERRDIDLIIALEYSAGNMFETLTLARDYAAEVNKPFPKIDDEVLEDKDWPKDCYVLQGEQNEPTIVYMPLFNRINCK
ncbi:cytosolic phospholipase A2 gamma-like, partial [Centroberyx affinis]|uniref:cytosolic phospholipase A2 gamma-like n=1 Tax=Centroberyx affinis TaxID=166261 RepID=UPI003A5C1796